MSWARAIHRSRQFLGALWPRLDGDDRLFVAEHLPAALQRLFYSMGSRDQRHALDVARTVVAQGEGDEALVQAALLHDVGKGPIRLWQRVAFVILQAVLPGVLARLAPPSCGGWRAPFDRLLRHGELGARLLETAGAPGETVRLVRYHEDASTLGGGVQDERLGRLRAADHRC